MNMICDFQVGCCYSVNVTHINDPHSFYVRSADISDYMDAIEKPGKCMSPEKIQLGQRVIFKSNILGKYVRGDIRFVNIDDEENADCDIFAIDYGCIEKSVLIEHVYSLDSQSEPENQCPPLAFHCRLYLCEPIGEEFTERVIETMRMFVGVHTGNITVMNIINDQLIVELRSEDCPRDISMMMGLLHITTFTKGSNQVNRFLSSARAPTNLTHTLSYKHKNLKVGDILHVRVQSGTSLAGFYVAETEEYKKLIYSQPSFLMYCQNRNMPDEEIVPGRLCAVKLNTPPTYERAIIKEILEPNSTALLKLVDWGTEVESKFSWIRSVASEIYVTQPMLAIYCSTDEDQVWETSLPKFLFRGYEFVIKIMELGNGFQKPYRVNIYPWKM